MLKPLVYKTYKEKFTSAVVQTPSSCWNLLLTFCKYTLVSPLAFHIELYLSCTCTSWELGAGLQCKWFVPVEGKSQGRLVEEGLESLGLCDRQWAGFNAGTGSGHTRPRVVCCPSFSCLLPLQDSPLALSFVIVTMCKPRSPACFSLYLLLL